MRLNENSMKLAKAVLPKYDRARVKPGIVHLGVGAFHRAHQAVYIDDILKTNPDWGIVGASLRSATAANALNPQNGLYTVTVKSGNRTDHRIIGSLLEVIDASSNPESLLIQMADPAIRIVTLTITEKGYCIDPATGNLNHEHPDIVNDLATPNTPRSAIGIIVEALRRRKIAGTGPFTVLCCDNLPQNGQTTRVAVLQLAELQDAELGKWIDEEVAFPSTMIDRIVPAITSDDKHETGDAIGLVDDAPVVTEPFCQWIVEDDFCAGRPELETVGVQLVDDVQPFELMKLRMLNGSHSTLAYLGYLAGHQTVADAIMDPEFETLIYDMMTEEIIPTLVMPSGTDLFAYRDQLIDRFKNHSLKHRTWQIAMDGSQKLPQRLLDTIRDRLSRNKSIDRLAMGVAGWMCYVTGTDKAGNAIDVRDPMAAELKSIGEKFNGDPEGLVKGYAAVQPIFGNDLPQNTALINATISALIKIKSNLL